MALTVLAAVFTSCRESQKDLPAGEPSRSVYYWKTVFKLGNEEQSFLSEHRIGRMYLRMFDVDVVHNYTTGADNVEPVATVKFESAKPDSIEIVPVVFITLDALKCYAGKEDEFAGKIVGRVLNMCSYNDLGHIPEIQFDCDWTQSTRESFVRLCVAAKEILHPEGILLSGTIRLHQIEEAEYPFDRGVLMLYNTGAIQNPSTTNSIIHYGDVEKYLGVEKRVSKFRKARKHNCRTVDFAYPTYGWNVAFNDEGRFIGILPKADLGSIPELEFRDGDYAVKSECLIAGIFCQEGTIIRPERSDISEVIDVKRLVDEKLPGLGSNIVYHLDMSNLSKYTFDEIDEILD